MPEINIEFLMSLSLWRKGTRWTVSEYIPALAPINGVPFLDLLLNDLFPGMHRIILGIGYLSEQMNPINNVRC